MKNKKIVVLIDIFAPRGGAFSAAYKSVERYREVYKDVYFICSSGNIENNDKYNILKIYTKKEVNQFVVENQFDLIHYFKSAKQYNKQQLFRRIINSIEKNNKQVKILTTVCQQPSYGKTILTPFEIKKSDKLLFIDKTAYNDPLFSFIPLNKKDWFYLYDPKIDNFRYKHLVKTDYSIKENVVFGRGSTLNKCPKDTIEIFDKINIDLYKKFIIVGVPEGKNWLLNKIKRRGISNIVTCPIMPMNDYLEIISKVDIFLYYLPPDIYSSLDGSLLDVLRLGIPTVVYGPPAPKECINHGINGFVANTKEDFVYYAELLASNYELRKKIGEEAKVSTFKDEDDYKNKQIKVIEKLLKSDKKIKIEIKTKTVINICIRKALAETVYLFNKIISLKDKLK